MGRKGVKKTQDRGGFIDMFMERFRGKPAKPASTLGVSGATAFAGFLDWRETDADLIGAKRYTTFSNMLANCSIVGAGVRYYLGLIGKAGWKVQPAEDGGAKAEELAELVDEILFSKLATPWHRVVRRASMFRFWGFSMQEWTAIKREDGVTGFLDVEPRPQVTIERWDLDPVGVVFGVFQRSPQTQQEFYIPRSKLVYMVDDSLNDSPEGLGLFRHMAEPARRLKRYEQLEGWGYETDLRGIPIGRAPLAELRRQEAAGTITAAERLQQEKGITDFLTGHIKNPSLALLLDSLTYQNEDEASKPSAIKQWDVDLLSSNATSHESILKAIERITRELARIMGVESLLLGESGAGSLALSRDKTQQFGLLIDGSLKEVSETFEADLVSVIFELNGWDMDLRPKLKTEAIRYRDVNDITSSLRDLAQAGAPLNPADDAVGELFDLLGLTKPNLDLLMEDSAITVSGDPGGGGVDPEDGDSGDVNPTAGEEDVDDG